MKPNILDDYIDKRGFICHLTEGRYPTDCGDSAQRMGMVHIAEYFLSKRLLKINATATLMSLQSPDKLDGEWVRYWDHTKWAGKRHHMSLDQMRPLFWLMVLDHQNGFLKRTLWSIFKRYGFLWNTTLNNSANISNTPDFIGLYFISFLIRGSGHRWLWPVLMVVDLPLIANSMIRVIVSHIKPDNVGDDLNHILDLICCRVCMPTPSSWIARLIYRYGRGRAGVNRKSRLKGFGPQTALDHYFRSDNAPPINEIYEPILKRWL